MGNMFGRGACDGVDLSRFSSIELPESLQCSLCWKMFYEPVTTRCGHTFCKPCLQSWMSKQSVCPIDRNPISRRSLTPNKAINDICASLWEMLNSESSSPIKLSSNAEKDKVSPSEVTLNVDDFPKERWDTILSENVLKNSICSMHAGVVVDPIMTSSGVSNCRVCVEKKPEKTLFSIAWGRSVPSDEYIQNRALDELVQAIPLGCFHSLKKCERTDKLVADVDGCPLRMLVHERREHEPNCEYAIVPCSIDGCREKLRKRDYEQHLTQTHQAMKEKQDTMSGTSSISRLCSQIYSTYRNQSSKQTMTDCSKPHSRNTSPVGSTRNSDDGPCNQPLSTE